MEECNYDYKIKSLTHQLGTQKGECYGTFQKIYKAGSM